MTGWRWGEWVLSTGTVMICTAVAWAVTPYVSTVDQAMLYFVGAVLVASRTGTWPSFLSVVLSIAAFNYFFVPPRFTFDV
jgi:two-component system sensor histidine kinase KdpD